MKQAKKKHCPIHDCNSAICPGCKHRAYTYEKEKTGLAPEEILINDNLQTPCDFCGRQVVTVDRVTSLCPCPKCKNKRELEIGAGLRVNEPLECNCKEMR